MDVCNTLLIHPAESSSRPNIDNTERSTQHSFLIVLHKIEIVKYIKKNKGFLYPLLGSLAMCYIVLRVFQGFFFLFKRRGKNNNLKRKYYVSKAMGKCEERRNL